MSIWQWKSANSIASTLLKVPHVRKEEKVAAIGLAQTMTFEYQWDCNWRGVVQVPLITLSSSSELPLYSIKTFEKMEPFHVVQLGDNLPALQISWSILTRCLHVSVSVTCWLFDCFLAFITGVMTTSHLNWSPSSHSFPSPIPRNCHSSRTFIAFIHSFLYSNPMNSNQTIQFDSVKESFHRGLFPFSCRPGKDVFLTQKRTDDDDDDVTSLTGIFIGLIITISNGLGNTIKFIFFYFSFFFKINK